MMKYVVLDGNLLDEVFLDGNQLDEFPMIRKLHVKYVKMMFIQVILDVTEKGILVSSREMK